MGCWAWYVDLSIKAITALLYGWSEVITSGSFGMSTRRRYHAEVLRDGREEPERQSQNSIAVLLSAASGRAYAGGFPRSQSGIRGDLVNSTLGTKASRKLVAATISCNAAGRVGRRGIGSFAFTHTLAV